MEHTTRTFGLLIAVEVCLTLYYEDSACGKGCLQCSDALVYLLIADLLVVGLVDTEQSIAATQFEGKEPSTIVLNSTILYVSPRGFPL